MAPIVLGPMLFGVDGATAPGSFATVVTIVLAAAAACVVPLRRAMAVDPAVALRAE